MFALRNQSLLLWDRKYSEAPSRTVGVTFSRLSTGCWLVALVPLCLASNGGAICMLLPESI